MAYCENPPADLPGLVMWMQQCGTPRMIEAANENIQAFNALPELEQIRILEELGYDEPTPAAPAPAGIPSGLLWGGALAAAVFLLPRMR